MFYLIKSRSGTTLLELMIVAVILGILLTVLIVPLYKAKKNATDSIHRTEALLKDVLIMYENTSDN